MIALVTIMFGVCWLPIHAFHLALRFFHDRFPYNNNTLYIFKTAAHTLTFMNSMLNPFFYTIMGNNFRKQVFDQKVKYSSRIKNFYNRNNSNNNSDNISIASKRSKNMGGLKSISNNNIASVVRSRSNISTGHNVPLTRSNSESSYKSFKVAMQHEMDYNDAISLRNGSAKQTVYGDYLCVKNRRDYV